MTKREIAKLYINMKYGMKGVKGMTLKEAMINYYDKGITIKRERTGKLINSLDETMTVIDAIACDWIPTAKFVEPIDVIWRKVKFIAECKSNIKYANIQNEKAHKEAWIILEDNKMTGMLSASEMVDKVDGTWCVEIQGKEKEKLEEFVELLKNLF